MLQRRNLFSDSVFKTNLYTKRPIGSSQAGIFWDTVGWVAILWIFFVAKETGSVWASKAVSFRKRCTSRAIRAYVNNMHCCEIKNEASWISVRMACTGVSFCPSSSLRLLMVLKAARLMCGWMRPYCSALRWRALGDSRVGFIQRCFPHVLGAQEKVSDRVA